MSPFNWYMILWSYVRCNKKTHWRCKYLRYLLPVTVLAVTLWVGQTGWSFCVVLAGTACAIMFIAGVCMTITLTSTEIKLEKWLMRQILNLFIYFFMSKLLVHSLFALPLQQEVSTQAALTLISHTVVLTGYAHSVVLSRTFCSPLFNLRGTNIKSQALH